MKDLKGKTAIVTGGGGGIGGATCRRFAEEGAQVAVFDMNLEAAQKVADGIVAAGGTGNARGGSFTGSGTEPGLRSQGSSAGSAAITAVSGTGGHGLRIGTWLGIDPHAALWQFLPRGGWGQDLSWVHQQPWPGQQPSSDTADGQA